MNIKGFSDMLMMKMEKTDSNFEKFVIVNDNVVRITVSPEEVSLYPPPETSSEVCNMDAKMLIQNYSNFKESGGPGRIMYYEEDGSWVDYPEEVVDLVRRCFLQKNPLAEVSYGDSHSLLDFCRMLEVEFDTGEGRSIAWIDINGKCFFPNIFINKVKHGVKLTSNRPPMMELELNICAKGSEIEEIKANRNGKPEESSNSPGNRFQIGKNARWSNTRLLNESKKEVAYVQFKNFLQSMIQIAEPDATVTRIHKCTRSEPLQKAKLEIFMNHLQSIKKSGGDPNLVYAWYGTSVQGVEQILAHGFDNSNQFQCSQGYGNGVLFSPVKFPHHSAKMSKLDNNGEKHMILCRIILGRFEKIGAVSQQKLSSSNAFDSGVDDLKNPKYYTIWPDNIHTHILPEAVVSYTPSSTLTGGSKGNGNRKVVPSGVSIEGLLSTLKKSLSQPKANELHALYSSYKGGRIGREIFARRLRLLAGDERLRSIIRDIHG